MARAKNEEFNQIKYQNEFKKANYDRVPFFLLSPDLYIHLRFVLLLLLFLL